MTLAVFLMTLILAYLLGGSIPLADEAQNALFRTPFFIGLTAAFTVDMLWVCLRPGFRRGKICFQFMHVGIALILLGVGIGLFGVRSTAFYIPIDPNQSFDQVPTGEDSYADLGFSLSVQSFDVEKYPPAYALYRIETDADNAVRLGEAYCENGRWNFGRYGSFSAADLTQESGYAEEKYLDGGLVLKMENPKDKSYDAVLNFSVGSGSVAKHLRVNHPVSYAGWKFYLLSYDKDNCEYITLQAKHDPGVSVVLFGIWVTLAATFGHCIFTSSSEVRTDIRRP